MGWAVWPSTVQSPPSGCTGIASAKPLHRRHQRESLRPIRKALVKCPETGSTRTACKVQRISEIETPVERIDRHQNRVTVFERDVLDTRQCSQHARNITCWQFVEPAGWPARRAKWSRGCCSKVSTLRGPPRRRSPLCSSARDAVVPQCARAAVSAAKRRVAASTAWLWMAANSGRDARARSAAACVLICPCHCGKTWRAIRS